GGSDVVVKVWDDRHTSVGNARDALGAVTKAAPKNARAHMQRGLLLIKRKDYKEARLCLDEALRLDPKCLDEAFRRDPNLARVADPAAEECILARELSAVEQELLDQMRAQGKSPAVCAAVLRRLA